MNHEEAVVMARIASKYEIDLCPFMYRCPLPATSEDRECCNSEYPECRQYESFVKEYTERGINGRYKP